jgi:hypothetical protein
VGWYRGIEQVYGIGKLRNAKMLAGPVQELLIGRSWTLANFQGQSSGRVRTPVLTALPRSNVTTAYFGLHVGIVYKEGLRGVLQAAWSAMALR